MEVLFDTVNSTGMKQTSKYMKQVGHTDASMYFYVDKAQDTADKINAKVLNEETYCAHTKKKGLDFMTKASMVVLDKFMMIEMVHLSLN